MIHISHTLACVCSKANHLGGEWGRCPNKILYTCSIINNVDSQKEHLEVI